jgi:hypothetical protein
MILEQHHPKCYIANMPNENAPGDISMERDIGRLEGRIDSLEKRHDGLEKKMIEEIRSLNEKFDTMRDDMRHDMSNEMVSVRAGFSDVNDGINLLSSDLRDHMTREEASFRMGWKVLKVVATIIVTVASGFGWLYTNILAENETLKERISHSVKQSESK